VKPDLILVRYGEIGLKADFTRKNFENILIKNIKNSLKKENILFKIEKTRGRIFIYSQEIKKTINILQKIFGIKSVSPCFKTDSTFKSLKKTALKIIENKINEKTSFALRVKREGNHEYTSQDVAVFLGDEIVKKTKAKVDLTNPDVTIFVEIRDKNAFLFFEKFNGPGGLPLGSQGKILSLISSKDVSFLATWYMMKRGAIPVFLLSNKRLISNVKKFGDNWFLNPQIIDLSEKHNLVDRVASENNCNAVVTGDTIQSFSNVLKLKKETSIPILNPLVAMTEKEIQDKITELGLF
jgi:thiamine biosynthesis protein ThiI